MLLKTSSSRPPLESWTVFKSEELDWWWCCCCSWSWLCCWWLWWWWMWWWCCCCCCCCCKIWRSCWPWSSSSWAWSRSIIMPSRRANFLSIESSIVSHHGILKSFTTLGDSRNHSPFPYNHEGASLSSISEYLLTFFLELNIWYVYLLYISKGRGNAHFDQLRGLLLFHGLNHALELLIVIVIIITVDLSIC